MMSGESLLESLKDLTRHHHSKCDLYRWYVDSLFDDFNLALELDKLPWLPVRAFKEHVLKSIPDDRVFKTMLSSGTGGFQSKVYLDQDNAKAQQSKLIEIFSNAFGKGRYPMLVIDSEATIKDRKLFSARTAAINGFGIFSKGREFALDENMNLNVEKIKFFLDKHSGQTIFIFGFTFVVWENFVRQLEKLNLKLDLSNAFMLHGGGWKKLESQKVSNRDFKDRILASTQCSRVHNYYGMIEQTGSIYMECGYGSLHAPKGSDFLIRSTHDLTPVAEGEIGVVQLFSIIQTSYPGHSLLSEDIGLFKNASSCPCGSNGRILKILGRAERAEVRGCSDAVD
ncbi:long-chain fatty acid--CoA ligase [Alphaproteobacteria bacterium]|nr:long-chain fatty acid--CoA ligase [Alphaproteobacteria bacterium]